MRGKILIIFLLVLILLGGGMFGLWYIGSKSLARQTPPTNQTPGEQSARLDSDGDGLEDWEEELWNTDPNNPDSDGDGTTDGDELQLSRDPNKAGPDDYLITIDEKIGALLHQLDTAPKPEPDDNPLESALNKHYYTANNLSLLEPDNSATAEQYGQALRIALQTLGEAAGGSEMSLTLRALENQSEYDIIQLKSILQRYEWSRDRLLGLPVPASAVESHLTLLNAVQGIIELDSNLIKVLEDPILALENAREYPARYATLIRSFDKMNQYFKAKGIRFSPEDNIKIMIDL